MMVNTRNLLVGAVVLVNGYERTIVSKEKAWKAPEWLLTLSNGHTEVRDSYHSNKKWTVRESAGA